MATEKLQEARQWFESRSPEEDLTVHYLIAIACARFGLVTTATILHDVYCQDEELSVSKKQVRTTFTLKIHNPIFFGIGLNIYPQRGYSLAWSEGLPLATQNPFVRVIFTKRVPI